MTAKSRASCSRRERNAGKCRRRVPIFLPDQLAQVTGGRWTAQPVLPLSAFSVDSRTLRRGDVFVALKTEKRDGHDFLAAAEQAGASAALVARPQPGLALPQLVVAEPLAAFQAIARAHRRAFRGQVVGISGSAGKTSTKDLLALLLGGASSGVDAAEDNLSPSGPREVLATEGNLNNHLGVPLTLTRIDPARHAFAVIEAGISAPGEMQPLAEMIEPDVSLITLIAHAHTEALGGLDGVAREKARLPAATRPSGVAVFSRATEAFGAFRDLEVRKMVVERADVIRPAEPPKDTVYFTVAQRGDETAIALAYGAPPPLTFTLRRVSDGQAQNAVLGICAALWLGIPREKIQARLAQWQPAKLRGEIRRDRGRLVYVDCYNANPASMLDAIATFESMASAAAPRLYVLGCMAELGAESPALHHAVGRGVNLRPDDTVMIMGAEAEHVRAGLMERGARANQIEIMTEHAPMAARVAAWPGAVFVKGSRRYQLEKALETPSALTQPC
jgi:UDP-N-acetylmuramoyl-tripeptide--D-alanyl-D-alanine ligase